MKAVLISIQPRWCELIASRRKTIEVRKTRPKMETPFKCYIYCTEGKDTVYYMAKIGLCETRYDGKVIGEFVCDDIIVDERGENADVFSKYAQLSLVEQKKYGANKPLFGWHITDLKIYYKPKELGEFKPWCEKSRKTDDNLEMCCNCKNAFSDEDGVFYGCGLTRPPQSWCYVEELE